MATEAAPLDQADPGGDEDRDYPSALLVGSTCLLRFLVTGKPVAKARPRVTRNGHTYTPETTVTWEQNVGWQVREQLTRIQVERGVKPTLPFEGRVILDLRFNFTKPKSTPKKVTSHLKRPDYDNLAKGVTDALQNLGLFKDDSQITDCTVRKRFATQDHPEGVEIEVTAWQD